MALGTGSPPPRTAPLSLVGCAGCCPWPPSRSLPAAIHKGNRGKHVHVYRYRKPTPPRASDLLRLVHRSRLSDDEFLPLPGLLPGFPGLFSADLRRVPLGPPHGLRGILAPPVRVWLSGAPARVYRRPMGAAHRYSVH